MKKNKIFTALFILLIVAFLFGFAIVVAYGETYSFQGVLSVYDEKEIVQIKKGESIPLEDINPKFKQFKEKGKLKNMQLHYQSGYTLTGLDMYSEEDLTNETHDVFVDENGCVSGVKTGVYKLEYALIQTNIGEIRRPDTYVFKNTIAVYEAEEGDYEPLPTDFRFFNERKSYILTQDITLDANGFSAFHRTFTGVIINPYGYTLTIPASLSYQYRRSSVFYANKGIIDGLKIHFESEEKDGWFDSFYGISKYNYGLIQNCEMTGEAIVRSREKSDIEDFFLDGAWTNLRAETWFLPKDGFTQNNKVAMTVRTDGEIDPYGEYEYDRAQYTFPVEVRVEDHWIWKNNEVKVDAYYDTDVVKATRRYVELVEHGTPSTNTCLPLTTPSVDKNKRYTVSYKLPLYAGEYKIIERETHGNAVLEIPSSDWNLFRRSEPKYDGQYYIVHSDVEVKYWLVNGEKKESLDDILVTQDTVIEPCIKYKETSALTSWNTPTIDSFRNKDDELVVSVQGENGEYEYLGRDFFYDLFNNPYNEIPSKILLKKEIRPYYFTQGVVQEFMYDTSAFALLSWIRAGGKLEIESGNGDLAMIGTKYLCSADGSRLWYYFPDEGEKEVRLHSRIEEINGTAFFAGEHFETLDLTAVKKVDYGALDACVSLKTLQLGSVLSLEYLKDQVGTFSFSRLLSNQKALETVTIDKENARYEVKDGFVFDKSSEITLVYAPYSLSGKVVLPDGISDIEENVFNGRDIEELVIGKGLTVFREEALLGLPNLRRLHFGETGGLKSVVDTSNVHLPMLEEVTFDENISEINLNSSLFADANLKTVVLPNAFNINSMFTACEAYVIENAYYCVRDGVLFRKSTFEEGMYELIAYPAKKEGTAYTVPETVKEVKTEAFYGAKLEEITLSGAVEEVESNAFYGVPIQRLHFVGEGQVYLRVSAFARCNELTEVTAENGVYFRLDDAVFKYCGKLSSFPFAQTLAIGDEAFYGTGELTVEIGYGVDLGTYAFRQSGVKTASFVGYTGKIKEGTFKESAIESIDFGGATGIENKAFKLCENLTYVDLKEVQTIGDCAFQYAGVRTVVGEKVVSFGLGAFSDTENLETVRLPSATEITSNEAFLRSGVQSVELPLVSVIPNGTFHGCERLTTLTLAEYIKADYASFKDCVSLTSLNSKIADLGSYTFQSCKSLESVTIEAESIWISGSDNFKDCTALKTVKFIQTNKEKSSSVSNTAFAGVTQAVDVYMDVGADFVWEGSVPSGFTLYVREGMKEIFVNSWIVNEDQIVELSGEEWAQV